MSVGAQKAVAKMRTGLIGGQSRVAQPPGVPFQKPSQKKKAKSRGLRGWYDFSDLSTQVTDGTSENRITFMYDKSGRGYHLEAPVAELSSSNASIGPDFYRPQSNESLKNGLPVGGFATGSHVSGSHQDNLYHRDRSHFNFMHTGPTTVFIVFQMNRLDITGRPLLVATTYFNSGTLPVDTGYELDCFGNQFNNTAGGTVQVINRAQGGNETTVSNSGHAYACPNFNGTWAILCAITQPTLPLLPPANTNPDRGWIYTNNEDNPSLNGGTGVQATGDSSCFFGIGGAVICDEFSNAVTPKRPVIAYGGYHQNLRIGEVKVFEGKLSDTDRINERDELNEKWAVW